MTRTSRRTPGYESPVGSPTDAYSSTPLHLPAASAAGHPHVPGVRPLLNLPLIGLVVIASLFNLCCITWGLPNADDWAIDSITPLGPLYYAQCMLEDGHWWSKYPPLHFTILALLYLVRCVSGTRTSGPDRHFRRCHRVFHCTYAGSAIEHLRERSAPYPASPYIPVQTRKTVQV